MSDDKAKVLDLSKHEKCSYLLPDPGGEVVREILAEVRRLQAEVESLRKDAESWRFYYGTSTDVQRAIDSARTKGNEHD